MKGGGGDENDKGTRMGEGYLGGGEKKEIKNKKKKEKKKKIHGWWGKKKRVRGNILWQQREREREE